MLGHCQDERALVRHPAFEEGVELVGHGRAVAARRGLDRLRRLLTSADHPFLRAVWNI